MRAVYHLGLDKQMIEGAKFAFLPGDPCRVPLIAKAFDRNAEPLASNREYTTYLSRLKNTPVLVTSTGIGGPSTSIAVDELGQLGVNTFIRIGTTGAIREDIGVGDVVITTGSVRLDGASTHYAPVEYPAVADHGVTHALIEAAIALGLKFHVGITASCDTFYPGQERYDSCSGYVIERFRGSMEEWRNLKVLNYEMESATLLTMCAVLGLRAGCAAGVVVNRTGGEEIDERDVDTAKNNAVNTAVRAMEILIS